MKGVTSCVLQVNSYIIIACNGYLIIGCCLRLVTSFKYNVWYIATALASRAPVTPLLMFNLNYIQDHSRLGLIVDVYVQFIYPSLQALPARFQRFTRKVGSHETLKTLEGPAWG